MAEAEQPWRSERKPTVDDIRQLMAAATPHFSLQLRNRIRKLISTLPSDDPARLEGERAIAQLSQLAVTGEVRGESQDGERPLPSLSTEPEAR